jgi:hypothetical protein
MSNGSWVQIDQTGKCGLSAALCDAGMYDDPECNFGVCEVCYDDLPETLKDKEK